MTRADILRQVADARRTMQALARLFPGCFHADGRAIVAEARMLPALPVQAGLKPPNVAIEPGAP